MKNHRTHIRAAFVVNASPDSAIGERARIFAERLDDRLTLRVVYRGGSRMVSALQMLAMLLKFRPDVVYVFDLAVPGVLGASVYKLLSGCPLIIETGDEIYQLARAVGRRGTLQMALTAVLEMWSLNAADCIVARGHDHVAVLQRKGCSRVEWLPDGVEADRYVEAADPRLRQAWAPKAELVVGLVGNISWNRSQGNCYGWELLEALAALHHRSVRGVIIGDGDGCAALQHRCTELGLAGRVVFTGRVSPRELPRFLSAVDIALTTQTDDEVGRVRTTGKLPVYMAAGKFILATRVGEAARVLPDEMLLDYSGSRDRSFPARLARRIEEILNEPECLKLGEGNRRVAKERFDYDTLSPRLEKLLIQLGRRNR